MAEVVLFNIADRILGNLGSLSLQELGLLVGVQDELIKLKNTISTIRDVLLDAEEKYQKSNPCHQIRGWLARLKDAVYEADDLLDEFSTKALRQKVMTGSKVGKQVRLFFSCSNQLAYRLTMGHKIKKIRETLAEIAKDRTQFHLEERRDETQVVARKRDQAHSYLPEEKVIGRGKDKEEIIKRLLDSNVEENVLIIPIVGMGGLGKTTLARLVYDDDRVKTNFGKKLWVCVSDNFDVKVIVEKIIESATKKKPDQNLEMDTLKDLLQEKINGKKYLLVLDDLWNEDRGSWIGLEDLLLGGARGSRIIITTRSKKVAKITSTVSPYVLKGLPINESWSLFTQLAFEKGLENPSLVEIGREIVRKCCGVPLAIRTIGTLLYTKDFEEWESVKKRKFSEITQQETSILPILKLSYDNLPSHLKHCFAYCRLFPKDHEIDVEMLIYLWMGQGFVNSLDPSKCLKEIGCGYFKDLLWRSFFQEVKEDELGNVTSCKMHDLMHDLAVFVAGMESTTLSSNAEIVHEKTHHVSIGYKFNLYGERPITTWLKANKLQTFLHTDDSFRYDSFPYDDEKWTNSNLDAIVSNFKHLRVLGVGHLRIERVPQSIGKLKHLRYLNLSWSEIEVLPSSVTRLQNLVILNLSWCKRLKELPEDIDKLISLEHLDIEGCDSLSHMPHGLGQLTSLETLTSFLVSKNHPISKHCYGLRLLDGLNNLRELGINWREDFDYDDVDANAMSIEDLQPHPTLKGLQVWGYQGVRSPRWLSCLTNLVNLSLVSFVSVKHFPPLDRLSSLQYLSIKKFDDLEYMEDNGLDCPEATFLSSLKTLQLEECPNLKGWRIASTSMTMLPSFSCLSKLEIKYCPKLSSMPLFPSVEGELEWKHMSSKPLVQTMMMTTKAAPTSSSSPSLRPLSKLTSLKIHNIEDLEILPEGLRNLTSLNDLLIEGCPKLISLAEEGFRGLTSLRSLSIWHCPKLTSLPEAMRHLTALQKLKINYCDELSTRCKKGADWPKIAHIPFIRINGKLVPFGDRSTNSTVKHKRTQSF